MKIVDARRLLERAQQLRVGDAVERPLVDRRSSVGLSGGGAAGIRGPAAG